MCGIFYLQIVQFTVPFDVVTLSFTAQPRIVTLRERAEETGDESDMELEDSDLEATSERELFGFCFPEVRRERIRFLALLQQVLYLTF